MPKLDSPSNLLLTTFNLLLNTLMRFIGCKQGFRNAVNDRIGLEPDSAGSQ